MLNVELVTRRDELAGLAARWDELAQNDPRDAFFRTFGWYRAWMEHIRPDAEPFVIVVRDAAGRIVGLAPLCRLVYRDLGLRLPAIAWAGREVVSGDFLDFISESAARAHVIPAILNFLWEGRAQWNLLVMGELIEGGDSDCAFQNWSARNRISLRRQEERLCPYIALPDSFDGYLNTLSSTTRYHIRRRTRDLEKKGARIEVFTDPGEIVKGLDALIRLHLARWQKDNLPGTMGRPGFAAFLRDVCTNSPAGSECKLYMLSYEGLPAAALLTFYCGRSALYYQAGWDPDSPLSSLSPGVVLMARSIHDAIDSGLQYYEFLRGDEAYKSRWTKTFRKTSTLLLAGSFMAREYLRAGRLKDFMKHRLLAKPAQVERSSEQLVSD